MFYCPYIRLSQTVSIPQPSIFVLITIITLGVIIITRNRAVLFILRNKTKIITILVTAILQHISTRHIKTFLLVHAMKIQRWN